MSWLKSHLVLFCNEISGETNWGTLNYEFNLNTTWAWLLLIALFFFWEESESRTTLAAWKWQSTPEPLGDPHCETALAVFSCASQMSRLQWFLWGLGFLQRRPCWDSSWSLSSRSESKLFRLRFQSTSFYYILMIRLIFYSLDSSWDP